MIEEINLADLEGLVERDRDALRYLLNWAESKSRVCTFMRTFTFEADSRTTTQERLEHLWETLPILVSHLRSAEARMRMLTEALSAAEELYQRGILAMTADEIQRVHDLRRAALNPEGK